MTLTYRQFITMMVLSLGKTEGFSISTSNSPLNANTLINRRPIMHDRRQSRSKPSNRFRHSSVYEMKGSDDLNPSPQRTSYDYTKEQSSKDETFPFGLSAASISSDINIPFRKEGWEEVLKSAGESVKDVIPYGFDRVLGAALLITSNTVGASMMVLPELASGPGLLVSSGIILATYMVNLVSGLLIAEVAINQYETSACDVPSSFKEFADVNFKSNSAGTAVALISMFVNTCVLSFDFVRGGQLVSENELLGAGMASLLGGSDTFNTAIASTLEVLGIVALVGTQSSDVLSKIASFCCVALFVCFAGLVLPGLASIHDPLSTFMMPGTTPIGSPEFVGSVSTLVPIVLTTLIYQNIVPTVTKMLNYDRKQVPAAIALGSFIPMLMYIAFCFTVLGGSGSGAMALSTGGLFLAGIKISSLFGSAMAGTMSIAQELENFLGTKDDNTADGSTWFKSDEDAEMLQVKSEEECLADGGKPRLLNLSTVSLSVIPPLLAGILFSGGEGFTGALSLSGSYCTPVLYGIIPVLLALNQRAFFDDDSVEDEKIQTKEILPGGGFSLGALGVGATTLISSHLVTDVANFL